VPGGGHKLCPLAATGSAQWWPPDVPGWLAQRDHCLPCDGLGEADAVAAGLADVGVVHEPVVDGDGGQGLGLQDRSLLSRLAVSPNPLRRGCGLRPDKRQQERDEKAVRRYASSRQPK